MGKAPHEKAASSVGLEINLAPFPGILPMGKAPHGKAASSVGLEINHVPLQESCQWWKHRMEKLLEV